VTEPDLHNWRNKVRTQDVVGFDVSPNGAIAFRFPRAFKVFTSRSVTCQNTLTSLPYPLTPYRDSPQPNLDCAVERENIKDVTFGRMGDRFIAVSDMLWFLWRLDESSKFCIAMQGEHDFVGHFRSR
jgi:hypothetical protein